MSEIDSEKLSQVRFESLPNDRQEHDVLSLLTRASCRVEGLRFGEIWQAIDGKRVQSARAIDQTLRRLKRRRAIALQRPRWVAL